MFRSESSANTSMPFVYVNSSFVGETCLNDEWFRQVALARVYNALVKVHINQTHQNTDCIGRDKDSLWRSMEPKKPKTDGAFRVCFIF